MNDASNTNNVMRKQVNRRWLIIFYTWKIIYSYLERLAALFKIKLLSSNTHERTTSKWNFFGHFIMPDSKELEVTVGVDVGHVPSILLKVKRETKRQNLLWCCAFCHFFCSYHILTPPVICYWKVARQCGIYLLTQSDKFRNLGFASNCCVKIGNTRYLYWHSSVELEQFFNTSRL